MRSVGLFEAKQKLSELVECAHEGERIGITRRGKLHALLVPAGPQVDLKTIFAEMDGIRKRARAPRNFNFKELIEEGRE